MNGNTLIQIQNSVKISSLYENLASVWNTESELAKSELHFLKQQKKQSCPQHTVIGYVSGGVRAGLNVYLELLSSFFTMNDSQMLLPHSSFVQHKETASTSLRRDCFKGSASFPREQFITLRLKRRKIHEERSGSPVSDSGMAPFFLSNYADPLETGHAVTTVTYLRDVVDAERRRQLVSISEGDLVGGSLQGDLCPQEETAPHRVPVQSSNHLKPVKYFTSFTQFTSICFQFNMDNIAIQAAVILIHSFIYGDLLQSSYHIVSKIMITYCFFTTFSYTFSSHHR